MSAMTETAMRNVYLSLGLVGMFLFWVLFPHCIDFKSIVKSFSLFHSFLNHVSLEYSVVTAGDFHQ